MEAARAAGLAQEAALAAAKDAAARGMAQVLRVCMLCSIQRVCMRACWEGCTCGPTVCVCVPVMRSCVRMTRVCGWKCRCARACAQALPQVPVPLGPNRFTHTAPPPQNPLLNPSKPSLIPSLPPSNPLSNPL